MKHCGKERSSTAGGFRPGEKWTVRETNCETVTLECNGQARQFKPPAKGKWDVLVASTKGWYVSLSRARSAMHVDTRDKAALRQSVMYPGERRSVWDLVQALRRSKLLSRDRMMPDLWAGRQAEIVREVGMER